MGKKVNTQKFIEEIQAKFAGSALACNIAITNLIKKGDLLKEMNGKILHRKWCI